METARFSKVVTRDPWRRPFASRRRHATGGFRCPPHLVGTFFRVGPRCAVQGLTGVGCVAQELDIFMFHGDAIALRRLTSSRKQRAHLNLFVPIRDTLNPRSWSTHLSIRVHQKHGDSTPPYRRVGAMPPSAASSPRPYASCLLYSAAMFSGNYDVSFPCHTVILNVPRKVRSKLGRLANGNYPRFSIRSLELE